MLRRSAFLLIAAIIFVLPAFAGNCNNNNFFGTYTRIDAPIDAFGDGTSVHQFVFHLTLTADGTARQDWDGLPDYQMNLGTGSASIGSWKCRNDGKLIVTFLNATYVPVEAGENPNTVFNDVTLFRHTRTTILFDVTNQKTLTRLQSRNRNFTAGEDPTNPTGGTLSAISNTSILYKRVVANDDDLSLP